MTETFTVETEGTVSVTDVTDRVKKQIPLEVEAGLCTIHVPHTTAGVTVNEAESRLMADIETAVSALFADDRDFRHDEVDDNAAAHLQSMLLGSSVTVPITAGDLALGTWQSLLLFDGDGPRTRTVSVTVVDRY
ncbi:MAG: secondary thiamine-phosphate synthase enzyme YjbQ [Halobacteriota archaeon]